MRTTLLFFILLLSVPNWASEFLLGEIRVNGLNPQESLEFKTAAQKILPARLNYSHLQLAMGSLYNPITHKSFEITTEEKNGKTDVIFEIRVVQKVSRIDIRGNNHLSDSDLKRDLEILEGDSFSEEKIKVGLSNIKKLLEASGYLNSSVSYKVSSADGATGVDLVILITEGEPCLISSLRFLSINIKLNDALEKVSASFINRPLTSTTIQDIQTLAMEHLFKNRYYSSILESPKVETNNLKTKTQITFTVTNPYNYLLLFEGQEQISEQRILKDLRLDPANRLSSSPLDDLVERISSLYKNQGYANVVIRPQENLYANEFMKRILFRISEGQRVKIDEFQMDGQYSRPPEYYYDFLIEHSGDLTNRGIFNSREIELGVKNLLAEIQNQGFIAAQIPGTRIEFNRLKNKATIKINLLEGPQTLIDSISFRGQKHGTSYDLMNVIGLKEKGPLLLGALESSSQKIVDYYKGMGYLEARVLNQGKGVISYSNNNTLANLTFDIYEGPVITVGSILIDGNNFTKDNVISRELEFEPGDVLTPEKIETSQQKLQRLGLFNSISIRAMEGDPVSGRRTVVVQVSEGLPGQLIGGVGINNDFDFTTRGFLGVEYRNLWGTGRGLLGRVDLSHKFSLNFQETAFTLGYTEPYVFGTKNTGRVNLIKSNRFYATKKLLPDPIKNPYRNPDGTIASELLVAADTSQGNLVLDRELSKHLHISHEVYGIATTRVYDIKQFGTISRLDIATLGPTLVYDRRDDPLVTKRGYELSLKFEFASPTLGSTQTVHYHKTSADTRLFIPIWKIIYATQVAGGYLKNLSTLSNGEVPQIKAFSLGGLSTIRGFDGVREKIPFPQEYLGGVPVDSWFLLTKQELRVPIYGNLGFAPFYDGGRVAIAGVDLKERFLWRDSAGLALRYETPLGYVSIDYARKLNVDSERGETADAFYFSIGTF